MTAFWKKNEKTSFQGLWKSCIFQRFGLFWDKNAQLGKDVVSKLFDQHNTALWDTYHLALMFWNCAAGEATMITWKTSLI